MTIEEFYALPFKRTGHLSMEDEHCSTYATSDGRFAYCIHVPYRLWQPSGRPYKHYRIDGKVYKSEAKLIKALEKL